MDEVEIRKLKPKELCDVAGLLNINDDWKKVLSIVKVDDNAETYRFNNDHILLIEQASKVQRRNCAEIFLEEWSTMGRKRPTVQILLGLVIEAQLFRTADYINDKILNRGPAERPTSGPAARVDNLTELFADSDDESEAKLEDHKNSTKKISDDDNDKVNKIRPKNKHTNSEETDEYGQTDFNNKTTKRFDDLSTDNDNNQILFSESSDFIKFSVPKSVECDQSPMKKLPSSEPKQETTNCEPKIPVFINETLFSVENNSDKGSNSTSSIETLDLRSLDSESSGENANDRKSDSSHEKSNNLNIPTFLTSNLDSAL